MRSITYIAASFVLATSAAAQEVRVEVVRHADGNPIPGALVAILSEKEGTPAGSYVPPVGRFSGRDGRASLTPPRRSGYRVRVEKVGYDVWTSALLVSTERPTRVRAGMKVRSLRLPPVTGGTETKCSSLGEQASVVGDMWGEIRKALSANSVTEAQGLAPLDIESYDRMVAANGTIISDRSDRRRANGIRPSNAIEAPLPPSSKERPAPFSVPEASVLLSDQFIANHCFTGIRGTGAEAGLLGLSFRPAKLGTTPDLNGVLWLDPTTYSLRHLVFEYVNLPVAIRRAPPVGRVEYQQLAGGEWVVTRWQLRVPSGQGDSASGPGTARGYHEIGGIARSTGAPAAAAIVPVAASTEGTRVMGTVIDGTTGAPLAGVEVSTFSGRQKTVTNRGGGYELWMEGAGRDSLVFDHPRLRLFRVARVRPFFATGGTRVQVSLVTPSYVALRQGLCPGSGTTSQPGGLAIGYVRDAAGNPVAHALVSATWRVLWVEQKGRLMSTNELRTVEGQSAADGSYLLCGFTRDAPVTVKVSVDGTPRVEEQIAVPRHLVIERDFRIP